MISSDFCRGLVADDENDQAATPQAFQLLHYIVGLRLAAGRLTVVDATNVEPEARRALLAVAKEHDVPVVAIVLDLPASVCLARNRSRPDRDFGEHVVKRQHDQLRQGMPGLAGEGLRTVHVLSPRRKSPKRRSCGPGWTTIVATRPVHSMSSVTCTAAARSWRRCWAGWATRSPEMIMVDRPAPIMIIGG